MLMILTIVHYVLGLYLVVAVIFTQKKPLQNLAMAF